MTTVGSPILFRSELDAGRLVPAHSVVAGDGRSFWLAYPLTRQHSAKIGLFRRWLCEQADEAREAAKTWIADAVIDVPASE